MLIAAFLAAVVAAVVYLGHDIEMVSVQHGLIMGAQ